MTLKTKRIKDFPLLESPTGTEALLVQPTAGTERYLLLQQLLDIIGQGVDLSSKQDADATLDDLSGQPTTVYGRALLNLADAIAGRAALGAAAQSDLTALTATVSGKQEADATLEALSGAATTGYGIGLLDLANAVAVLAYIGAASQSDLSSLSATVTGKQNADSTLSALSGAPTTSYGIGLLGLADAIAGRAYIGAASQSDFAALSTTVAGKQNASATLSALAALSTTTFGRGLLELLDAAAALAYIGAAAQSALDALATTVAGKQDASTTLAALSGLSTTSYGRVFLELADAAAALSYVGAASQSDLSALSTTVAGKQSAFVFFNEAATLTEGVASYFVAGTDVNIGISLAPKNNGSFSLSLPNAFYPFGTRAIDLQLGRVNPFSIASGDFSIVAGGENNEASADWSGTFAGFSNQADNLYSVCMGGENNYAGASHSACIGGTNIQTYGLYSVAGGGNGLDIFGDYSAAIAGENIELSGDYSGAIGGQNINVYGYNSVALGGLNNSINNDFSVILAGESNAADHTHSAVLGKDGITQKDYQLVLGGSQFAAKGDCQSHWTTTKVVTSSSTPANLFEITIPVGSCVAYRAMVAAKSITTADYAGWNIQMLFYNNGGTVTILGTTTISKIGNTAGASSWTITFPSTNSGSILKMVATGDTKTIRWVSTVQCTQVF